MKCYKCAQTQNQADVFAGLYIVCAANTTITISLRVTKVSFFLSVFNTFIQKSESPLHVCVRFILDYHIYDAAMY